MLYRLQTSEEYIVKRSVIIALVILFGLVAYFLIRSALRDDDVSAAQLTGTQTVLQQEAGESEDRPRAVVETVIAEPHAVFLTLKGRTAPNRMVTASASTTGIVVAAPDLEGKFVRRGTLLCRLDVDARQARVAEAEAQLNAQQVDFEAAQTLVEKGWAAPTRANSAKASRDAARATLDAARIELGRTRITAPFSGIFETRLAETGDFLSPGSPCGMIAELDPIRVIAEVTEEYASALALDAPVEANVLSAGRVEGRISYVARTANEDTRTFKIEAAIDNADGQISAGLTSDLRIRLGETQATKVSPAMLVLHDDGRLGIRHLTGDNLITFAEVSIIDDEPDGVWVTGLPETATVVAVGQDYLGDGLAVEPVSATDDAQ